MIIDFHSHALPGIDDGAKDEAAAVSMLETSRMQGVETVVLTPHYRALQCSVEEFLNKRKICLENLKRYAALTGAVLPQLKLGAEVAFSYELLQSDNIANLCIEGTNTMLVELPFSCWNRWIFNNLFELSAVNDINVVIAHAERYINKVSDIKQLKPLFDMQAYIQVNADSIMDFRKKRIVRELFNMGQVHIIGSDMHNNSSRKTMMGKAVKKIVSKYGTVKINEIMSTEKSLLEMV